MKEITDDMTNQELTSQIDEARRIVEQLHDLLHEDALHRLDLYQKYAKEPDDTKWSPDLFQRCQLIDALLRKLHIPTNVSETNET